MPQAQIWPMPRRVIVVHSARGMRARVGEPETRPFRAHVTVVRAKAPVDARAPLAALGDQRFGVATVDAFHVYESRLGGGPHNPGSTYVLRHRAALASN